MIKVCAYARVSTKKDDQENSLEAQKDYYLSYADDKEGMELYNLYHDSISATGWKKRKGFIQMLHDAGLDVTVTERGTMVLELSDREPLFNRIVTKDISRFTRSVTDEEIFRKLKDKGVFVDFTNVGLTTQRKADNFTIQIMTAAAQQESEDRSRKVLFGLERSAEKGRIRTRDNFYGYKYHVDTKTLTIKENEAAIVRLIYQLYIDGLGLRNILKHFERHNIKREGIPFSQTTVNRILKNPAYKGLLVRNKMESPLVFSSKKTATQKPEEEWKVHQDVIPAVVDADMWQKAQDARKTRLNQDRKGVKTHFGRYSGKIVCVQCGKMYVQNRDKNGCLFMNCATKKALGKSSCSARNIRNDLIDSAVNEFIETGLEDTISEFKKSYVLSLNKLKDELRGMIDNQKLEDSEKIKKSLDELSAKKDRLGDLYVMGNFSLEKLEEMSKGINREFELLNNSYEQATLSNAEIKNEIEEVNRTIKELKSFSVEKNLGMDIIMSMVSSISVQEFKGISKSDRKSKGGIIFKFEFKVFEKLNKIVDKYKMMGKLDTENTISIMREY
ncbi:recombinase family protein [Paenibacillus sp. FSL H3-0333]|uniref:recombinase family protein n=1 Tax=Paenibacillus sp. FSL H3-0333 TaxID=2921373 RepID=UPI0030F8DFD5